MGSRQSGVLNLKIAGIIRDNDILKRPAIYAMGLLKSDPTLEKPENSIIRHAYSQLVKFKNIWEYISLGNPND